MTYGINLYVISGFTVTYGINLHVILGFTVTYGINLQCCLFLASARADIASLSDDFVLPEI